MVEENICFLLNNFIQCSAIRTADVIYRSVERIPLYEKLSTYQVDVSKMNAEQAADFIIQNC